jgi:hypothetical protein
MGTDGQHHIPVPLPPWKQTMYPLYRSLEGRWSQSGQVGENLSPLQLELQTVQPAVSLYTNYAISAPVHNTYHHLKLQQN